MEAKAAAKRKGAFVMMVEQDLMLARFLAGLYSHKVLAVPSSSATLLLCVLHTLMTVVVCFTIGCSLHHLFNIYAPSVHHLFTIWSLSVPHLFTISSPPIHHLFTIC